MCTAHYLLSATCQLPPSASYVSLMNQFMFFNLEEKEKYNQFTKVLFFLKVILLQSNS